MLTLGVIQADWWLPLFPIFALLYYGRIAFVVVLVLIFVAVMSLYAWVSKNRLPKGYTHREHLSQGQMDQAFARHVENAKLKSAGGE